MGCDYQTTLNRKCGRLVGWAALDFCFRLVRLKQSHWRKNCKPCHFQNQSRSWQRKQDLKVKAKWNSAAQGRFIRDARDGGFQETYRTVPTFQQTPQTRCEVTTKSAFGQWVPLFVPMMPHIFIFVFVHKASIMRPLTHRPSGFMHCEAKSRSQRRRFPHGHSCQHGGRPPRAVQSEEGNPRCYCCVSFAERCTGAHVNWERFVEDV